MDEFITIGEDLRKVRLYLKIKSAELSLKANLFDGYVCQIEARQNIYPRLNALLSLAYTMNQYRKVKNISFVELRAALGENLMIDFIEMMDKREKRIAERGKKK